MAERVSCTKSFFLSVNFPLGDAVHHVAEAGWAFCRPDVVLHPRQSLDLSSRGTTSPDPAGHSAGRTSAMKKPAYVKQSLLDRCK